ncbi:MAG: hypothetical protein QUV35_15155 [Hydrogenophaga sp.]|uniref:hypothetical protein n=1 Tax=Hydrogenophaga sp. TaxID=1904254 RepID=UPI0026369A42|nr:hypothetical protein [Hydrogenophaga sp.]MDM7943960.1 hypothetical protein [Hydrogenophaga sp.]
MNSTNVLQTYVLWKGVDGELFRYIFDSGVLSDEGNSEGLRALKDPARPLSCQWLTDKAGYVCMPFKDSARILPDRTGVLVIFKPGSYTHPDGNDIFPCPNNAAIYNADGSLRCQVRFASGPERNADCVIGRTFTRTITHQTLPIGRRGDPIDPPIVQFGVLVGTREHPPESFYVLNTETGELTNGLFSVPC